MLRKFYRNFWAKNIKKVYRPPPINFNHNLQFTRARRRLSNNIFNKTQGQDALEVISEITEAEPKFFKQHFSLLFETV